MVRQRKLIAVCLNGCTVCMTDLMLTTLALYFDYEIDYRIMVCVNVMTEQFSNNNG